MVKVSLSAHFPKDFNGKAKAKTTHLYYVYVHDDDDDDKMTTATNYCCCASLVFLVIMDFDLVYLMAIFYSHLVCHISHPLSTTAVVFFNLFSCLSAGSFFCTFYIDGNNFCATSFLSP